MSLLLKSQKSNVLLENVAVLYKNTLFPIRMRLSLIRKRDNFINRIQRNKR